MSFFKTVIETACAAYDVSLMTLFIISIFYSLFKTIITICLKRNIKIGKTLFYISLTVDIILILNFIGMILLTILVYDPTVY